MKFFLIRHSSLTIVQAETESEAFEHYGCNQKGHSVEWKSNKMLELPDPVEVEAEDHWDGWWKAVQLFREKIGLLSLLFVCGCLFAYCCCADELPDSPTPKVETVQAAPHRFVDRTNKIEFTGMMALEGWDMGQTCDNLSHGGREYWLTQSCGKNIAITLGVDAGSLGLAWLLHRTGHHRLERIPMLWKAGDSLHGIIFSRMHGGI